MTSQEAFKHTCKPGYWLVNVAAIDAPQDWQEQVEPHIAPDGLIFGYPEKEFLAKQMRCTKHY